MDNIAAIYVRLSDEDRNKKNEESESIQNQKSMLINYCIKNQWQIYSIYCDENFSGADKNRPEFLRMIEDCRQKRVNIVVCKTQSRFSRDMEIIEKYIHGKFTEWNVRFVSIVDHADTAVIENKKSRQINGLINEWYLEDLSDNIRKTLYHKKIKGEYCCPYAPYGYMLDPADKHHFIIDEPAAEVVKSIFEMYKSGMGYIKIAKALNEQHVPPPAVYKAEMGLNYKNPNAENTVSCLWRDSTIYYILRHQAYTGSVVQGKTHTVSYKNKKRVKSPQDEWIVVPEMHERIISDELWNDVQNLIEQHRVKNKQFKTRQNYINPLRGSVFCGECGAGMWRMSYQCKDKRYKYYKCRTVKNSTGVCCNTAGIRQDDIEACINDEINKLLKELFQPEKIKLNTNGRKNDALSREEEQIKKLNSACERKFVHLYEDKINGTINDEQFKILNEINDKNIEKNKARLKYIEEEKQAKKTACNLSDYTCIKGLTFNFVTTFIKKIYVYKIYGNKRVIKILWNF